MAIAQQSAPMPSLVRSYDGAITLGYVTFAVVILAAIYFASGSFTDSDLSVMAVMP
jgi:hypothetical protein